METLHILTRVSTSTQTEDKGGTSLSTQREKGIELSKSLGMKYELHNEGGTSSSTDNLETRPDQLNVSVVTVSNWCRNQKQPSLGSIHRISDVLQCKPNELIHNERKGN